MVDKQDDAAQTQAGRKKGTRVEVLVDNLGPQLLKKGTVTDDPQVVALLDRQPADRPLVREVK